ncbi:MAG TPA: hypothetical protein VFQ54_05655 [Thermomicrobiales bacterium]|nr:hypothetical protein [Thermomicrobiales bacterium]
MSESPAQPAARPLSQLTYTRIQEHVDRAETLELITLHGHNQYGRDLAGFARAAAPEGHLLGLESYKGVFVGRDIVGYTWFPGPLDRPAPVFFGDALAEIERFLWDERGRQIARGAPVKPFLLGVEQGAIMALAAALTVPDLLSGVIAIGDFFPIVPGWDPPLAPLDGLPILLLESGAMDASSGANVLTGQPLDAQLAAWDATVTRKRIVAGEIPAREMSSWIAGQPVREFGD